MMRLARSLTLGLSLIGTCQAASADNIVCTLADETSVSFAIDRSQFVTAVSAEEPIRRKTTVVKMNGNQFPAEPFLIGDMRGFHAEGLGGSQVMFVMHGDGSAVLSNTRAGSKTTGRCEVIQ